MRRITTVFLAAVIALAAGAGACAAGQTMWGTTSAQISQQGTWRNEIRVVVVPMSARAVLAKCYDPAQDSAQLSQSWTAELKRLSIEKQIVVAIYVSRANSRVPNRIPLADLVKSPLLIVGAERLAGKVIDPFDHETLETAQSDQAIIAFERREGILGEYIGPGVARFEVRLVDPANLFDFAEWVEAVFRLPMAYPPELQDLYEKLSPSVPRQYLTSF